jgi:hypothetical protein
LKTGNSEAKMKAAAYLILEEEENKSHIPYKYKETKIWKVF